MAAVGVEPLTVTLRGMRWTTVLVLLALVLGGCGGGDESSSKKRPPAREDDSAAQATPPAPSAEPPSGGASSPAKARYIARVDKICRAGSQRLAPIRAKIATVDNGRRG